MQEIDQFIPDSEKSKMAKVARAWLDRRAEYRVKNPVGWMMNAAMSQFLLQDYDAAGQTLSQSAEPLTVDLIAYGLDYRGPQASEIVSSAALSIGHAVMAGLSQNRHELHSKLREITEPRWETIGEETFDGMPMLGDEYILVQIAAGNLKGVLAFLDENQPEWVSDKIVKEDDPDLLCLRSLCLKDAKGLLQGLDAKWKMKCSRLAQIKVDQQDWPIQIIHPYNLLCTDSAAMLQTGLGLGIQINPRDILPPSLLKVWRFE